MTTKPTYAVLQHWDYKLGKFSQFYTVLQINEQSPVRIVATPIEFFATREIAESLIRQLQEGRDNAQA